MQKFLTSRPAGSRTGTVRTLEAGRRHRAGGPLARVCWGRPERRTRRERSRASRSDGAGLLRGPGGRQLQAVLDRPQGACTTSACKAPMLALLAELAAGVRRRQALPAVPGRPVQQGQDAVQDQRGGHGRGRARRRRGTCRCPRTGSSSGAATTTPRPDQVRGCAARSPTTCRARRWSGCSAASRKAGFSEHGEKLDPAAEGLPGRPSARGPAALQVADPAPALGARAVAAHPPRRWTRVRTAWRARGHRSPPGWTATSAPATDRGSGADPTRPSRQEQCTSPNSCHR